jgi:hypothetical protein
MTIEPCVVLDGPVLFTGQAFAGKKYTVQNLTGYSALVFNILSCA